MTSDFDRAYHFGTTIVAAAKAHAIDLGLRDNMLRLALRQAAIDLATASVPDGWSLLNIEIKPIFPPDHPLCVPRKQTKRRSA
jgi:hypothetical protein